MFQGHQLDDLMAWLVRHLNDGQRMAGVHLQIISKASPKAVGSLVIISKIKLTYSRTVLSHGGWPLVASPNSFRQSIYWQFQRE
jgi:hypothetical protein